MLEWSFNQGRACYVYEADHDKVHACWIRSNGTVSACMCLEHCGLKFTSLQCEGCRWLGLFSKGLIALVTHCGTTRCHFRIRTGISVWELICTCCAWPNCFCVISRMLRWIYGWVYFNMHMCLFCSLHMHVFNINMPVQRLTISLSLMHTVRANEKQSVCIIVYTSGNWNL